MGKKKEEKLRRQIEVLKAQIRTSKEVRHAPVTEVLTKGASSQKQTSQDQIKQASHNLDYKKIKSGLAKTLFFSVSATLVLILLYIFENRWLGLIKFI